MSDMDSHSDNESPTDMLKRMQNEASSLVENAMHFDDHYDEDNDDDDDAEEDDLMLGDDYKNVTTPNHRAAKYDANNRSVEYLSTTYVSKSKSQSHVVDDNDNDNDLFDAGSSIAFSESTE